MKDKSKGFRHKPLEGRRVTTITQEYIDTLHLANKSSPYPEKRKWMVFSEWALKKGFKLVMYEAKTTYSRYITLIKGEKKFTVRYSNHKPSKLKEEGRVQTDCDFYVGICHNKTTTTTDAMLAVDKYFGGKK